MSDVKKTEGEIEILESTVKEFPCKCDHCPWKGKVGEAKIVEGKALCPICGGSLAANRTADQIMDAFLQCVGEDFNADGW